MSSLDQLFARLTQRRFNDPRITFAQLHCTLEENIARVHGQILDRADATALLNELRTEAPTLTWQDATHALIGGPDYSRALVTRATVDVRRMPQDTAERVTQLVWGERCEILSINAGNWAFVRAQDGYLGWAHAEALRRCAPHEAGAWRDGATHVVCSSLAPIFAIPERSPQQQVGLIPFATRVTVQTHLAGAVPILSPDGNECWLDSQHLLPLTEIPSRDDGGFEWLAQRLPQLIGVPYLWGGRSPFGYDCSGLVQALYSMLNIHLLRDADQQCAQGTPVDLADVTLGDLLFFDTITPLAELPDQPTRVTHVAFALDRTTFFHASRRDGDGVGWGSFDPASPYFLPSHERRLIGVRRYTGA